MADALAAVEHVEHLDRVVGLRPSGTVCQTPEMLLGVTALDGVERNPRHACPPLSAPGRVVGDGRHWISPSLRIRPFGIGIKCRAVCKQTLSSPASRLLTHAGMNLKAT